MRIRIDKVYGCFFHETFAKFEVIARVYINGQCRHKRLFFETRKEAESVQPGDIIDY